MSVKLGQFQYYIGKQIVPWSDIVHHNFGFVLVEMWEKLMMISDAILADHCHEKPFYAIMPTNSQISSNIHLLLTSSIYILFCVQP